MPVYAILVTRIPRCMKLGGWRLFRSACSTVLYPCSVYGFGNLRFGNNLKVTELLEDMKTTFPSLKLFPWKNDLALKTMIVFVFIAEKCSTELIFKTSLRFVNLWI